VGHLDENDEQEGAPSERALKPSEPPHEYSSGKALRFAIIAFSACVVSGLATATIMSYVSRGFVATKAAPLRPNVATATATVPAKPAPSGTRVANTLTYAADGSGHFFVDAAVNGVPVRFLVDTGATFVALSPDDAATAGIASGNLNFNEAMNTANGVAHAARTSLRSVRLGQLEIPDVTAVVMDQPMPFSLLGMSFLSRVDGYAIRDGVLTIEW
jgi:aspartyl protease family protein